MASVANPGDSPRIPDDARFKLARNRHKIDEAIAAGGGTALYAAHVFPHLGRFLPVLKEAGIRMVEFTAGTVYAANNPPSDRLYEGGRTASANWQHTVTWQEMAEFVRAIRDPLGPDVYLNVGPPGVANVIGLTRFTDEAAYGLSAAGADGLHTHLSSYEEVESLVGVAHSCGLMVEAYITEYVSDVDDYSYLGIPANTAEEVAEAGRRLEEAGVDIIGLLFAKGSGASSMDKDFYVVEETGEALPQRVDERLSALRESVETYVSIEGQVTPANSGRIREIGADVIIIGAHFDLAVEKAMADTIEGFRP